MINPENCHLFQFWRELKIYLTRDFSIDEFSHFNNCQFWIKNSIGYWKFMIKLDLHDDVVENAIKALKPITQSYALWIYEFKWIKVEQITTKMVQFLNIVILLPKCKIEISPLSRILWHFLNSLIDMIFFSTNSLRTRWHYQRKLLNFFVVFFMNEQSTTKQFMKIYLCSCMGLRFPSHV